MVPTIALVEDNALLSEIMAELLVGEGYFVDQYVRDFDTVARRIQDYPPDVILLDLMLPGFDGRTVLTQLKAEPVSRAIPVVILSAAIDELPKSHLTAADAILCKPVTSVTLIKTLEDVIAHEITSRELVTALN